MVQVQHTARRALRTYVIGIPQVPSCFPLSPQGALLRTKFECGGYRQQQGAPHSSGEQGAGQHIALAIARGLHWLHTHGIVHGDVRPSKGVPVMTST